MEKDFQVPVCTLASPTFSTVLQVWEKSWTMRRWGTGGVNFSTKITQTGIQKSRLETGPAITKFKGPPLVIHFHRLDPPNPINVTAFKGPTI